jgi:poly(3-hydroxybutyrate) depolymerase
MKRAARILATLGVLALFAIPARAQPDLDEWERRMLAGEFASAARFADQAADGDPGSAVWAYRAGAAHARAGANGEALRWLEAAADRGYSGVRTFETDDDLDPLRDHPRFGAALERVRARAAARLESFKQAAGKARPLLVLPRGHDPKVPAPLLIVLHGTGGTGREMGEAWRAVAAKAGVILLAPDAIRPSGAGFAWVFRDEAEWYIRHLIETVREHHAVGPVILAGFSQGANIAFAMGRSDPDLFDAIIPVAGHWEGDLAAMPPGGGDAPRWYLLIGDRDPWHATYDEALSALTGAGHAATLRKLPDHPHAMPTGARGRGELERALRWCLERDEPGP